MSQKFRGFVAAGLFIVSAVCSAGTKTTSVVVEGVGASEEEATAQALGKAVSQVKGVRSSVSVSTGKAVADFKGETNIDGKKSTGSAQVSVGSTPDSRMSASGKVSRHEVLETSTLPDGKVKVKVKAYFDTYVAPVYNAPGSKSGKMRVALVDPDWDRRGYNFFGAVSGEEMANDLRSAMERSFIDAGAFSVLDRQTMAASMAELSIVASSLTNATERAKLHNFRGADVIVIPKIKEAFTDYNESTNNLTSQRQATFASKLLVEVRAIVPATGEIVFSDLYTIRQAVSREDAVGQVGARASADLAFKMTGKQVDDKGLRPNRVRPSVSVDDLTRQPELPPEEQEGARLPFDR